MKHSNRLSMTNSSFKWLFVALLLCTGHLFVLAQSSHQYFEVNTVDRHAAQEYRAGEMIVKFKSESSVQLRSVNNGGVAAENAAVEKALAELGATLSEPLMPLTGAMVTPRAAALRSATGKLIQDSDLSQLYLLHFDEAKMNLHRAMEKLQELEEVEFVEPNYIVHTLADESAALTDCDVYQQEPLYGQQWGHGPLKLPFLWKQEKITDKRPVIAILDTGVDIEHPDLQDNIWTNEAEASGLEGEDDDANGFADDIHGWDFVNQTGRIGDWNGHGTHCAGIAAAVGKNGKGITGANPDALIMPVTVMQSDGSGDVATIIKGIDYAAANGADVISMSIGGYGYSLAEEQALAKAYNKAVLVAAAGNDNKCIYSHLYLCPVNGRKDNGPMYPAAFTFVLGVEASTKDGGLAPFSNFDEDGPVFSTYDEEKLYNYELRAPGEAIMSTYPGGKYKALNGTSMACPFVAGAVSRLLQCKEYSSWEVLFGDLIHTRKQNGYGNVDFEAAYKITDADRKPALGLVTYVLKDTIEGDADGKADAGETIAFYPTLRNEWGQAKNITFSLELGENEDPTIIEFIDTEVDFGKQLSSYAKNISANPIRFKLNDNCADGRKIRLVLRATCDNMSEELIQEISLTAENGVEIGGMITEDMTLYPDVHYIVTQPLAVPEGVTLTILPGSILKFKDGTGISVSGHLNAIGEPENMIFFTKSDNSSGDIFGINGGNYSYCVFTELTGGSPGDGILLYGGRYDNCIFKYISSTFLSQDGSYCRSLFDSNSLGLSLFFSSSSLEGSYNNICNNVSLSPQIAHFLGAPALSVFHRMELCNVINNRNEFLDLLINFSSNSSSPTIVNDAHYWGSNNENLIRQGIMDINTGYGFLHYDLNTRLTRPSAEAHGIVWKVVVNGYDAQDEFELLPPLGVGKHKFEVYFNRPMDTAVSPTIAMGVRPPYTSHSIAEEGSWSADSLIYTAYLTIDGKTGADGLNRIYVADAEDDEHFEIPIENTRFHVQVAAAGSMATGLMAEAGLGKVSLTWETDEEDFEDLLGYNIYRYTDKLDSIYVEFDDQGNWFGGWKYFGDTTIINPSVLESDATSFVDYDVVPGTTYYYVIKQLTTSLSSHALSNAVAATPLTAQKGDANGSMSVDIADVVTEVAYITYQDPQPFIFDAADVNSDQKVNVLDVVGTVGIITAPAQNTVSAMNDEAVAYYVQDGVLYMENSQYVGGVQVRLNTSKDTEIKVLESLSDMEQTSTWTSDTEYLFLAYSMSGRSIAPGKHALLKIDDSVISEMVVSDVKGHNIVVICKTATGIGKLQAMQLQQPSPNAFSDYLNVPYVIGKAGNHEVRIVFSDLAGRCIDVYNSIDGMGEYVYTWRPQHLQDGMYLVNFYVDGVLMQTAKVMCKH